MENNQTGAPGPRPTGVASSAHLSPARRRLLELLAEQDAPTPLTVLCRLSGSHENTVRGHLTALESAGLVTRESRPATGRGRPAWLWQVRPGEPDEYAGLAATLARTLRRTSSQPEDDALSAGEDWGRELATRRHGSHQGAPLRRTRDLLERLGFAPEGEVLPTSRSARLRLTRCPLLEVAHEEPTIVCNVHRGLAAGVLTTYGAEDPEVDLVPFAEPGACILTLTAPVRRAEK
ncbi:helix-turn-helix transcriptional regulator [Nocardioides montaniterrae]